MKKIHVTIILVLSILTLYFANKRFENSEIIRLNEDIKTDFVEKKLTPTDVNIYVYDASSQKLIEKIITLKNDIIELDEFVNIILHNSKYLSKNMELLAIYELSDTKILIKLNDEFSNLTNESIEGLIVSLNTSIKKVFKDIKDIQIQIDANI